MVGYRGWKNASKTIAREKRPVFRITHASIEGRLATVPESGTPGHDVLPFRTLGPFYASSVSCQFKSATEKKQDSQSLGQIMLPIAAKL